MHLSLGTFYPATLTNGSLWPIEGMPTFLRDIVYFFPNAYAIESLRSILARGWGIEQPVVYMGIVITCGWTVAFLVLTLVIFRLRKYTG